MLEKTVNFGVFLVFGINSENKALKIYKKVKTSRLFQDMGV